jgi:hypothetical protein
LLKGQKWPKTGWKLLIISLKCSKIDGKLVENARKLPANGHEWLKIVKNCRPVIHQVYMMKMVNLHCIGRASIYCTTQIKVWFYVKSCRLGKDYTHARTPSDNYDE